MGLAVVLSVGLDSSLLWIRNAVLQSVGYNVVSASSIKETVERFLAGDFDLVILCHSIPSRDRDRLACLIRASGSLVPIVCIAEIEGQSDTFASATLDNQPINYLAGIREVLIQAGRPPAVSSSNESRKLRAGYLAALSDPGPTPQRR